VSQNGWGINQILKTIIMLKNILKLEGAQKLTKGEQKSINGGNVKDNPFQCDQWNSAGITTYVKCRSYLTVYPEINWSNTNSVCWVMGVSCAS
jgi:hypothetical protein